MEKYAISFETIDTFAEAGRQRDKKTFHLQSLIEGALYRELDDEEMAQTVSLPEARSQLFPREQKGTQSFKLWSKN